MGAGAISPKRRFRFWPLLLLGLLFCFLGFGGLWLSDSSWLALGHVEVEGLQELSKEELLVIAGIGEPVNLLRVRPELLQHRLEQDLRIRRAEVERKFPWNLRIAVEERRPLAYVTAAYGILAIDRDGTVLNVQRYLKDMRWPFITGISAGQEYIGDKLSQPQVIMALQFLDRLDAKTLEKVSEVHFVTSEKMQLYLLSGAKVRLGDGTKMTEKAQKVQELVEQLGDKLERVDYFDVSFATPVIKFKP